MFAQQAAGCASQLAYPAGLRPHLPLTPSTYRLILVVYITYAEV